MSPISFPSVRGAAHLREMWSDDRPTFGLWSSLADPVVAEIVGDAGFDFVCVDLQHGFAVAADLPGLGRAFRVAGSAPIVRVAWNEPAPIMRVLDTGAAGVVVPMINDADEARRAVDACKYPPEGERSWGPMWSEVRPDGAPTPDAANADTLVILMVETRHGLDAIEEIVAVPGVDAIFLGPNDLALGCGYGRISYRDSSDVAEMMQRVVDVCRDVGIAAGLYCASVEMALDWAERGARLLVAATDTTLLRNAAAAARVAATAPVTGP